MDESEEEKKKNDIKDKIRVICICKGIRKGRVCDAIEKGASSVREINRKTGCGSGGCQGTRCGPVIEELLKQKSPKNSVPSSATESSDLTAKRLSS